MKRRPSRLSRGLCEKCPNSVISGERQCPPCRVRARAKAVVYRAEKRKAKICQSCGTNPMQEGRVWCKAVFSQPANIAAKIST